MQARWLARMANSRRLHQQRKNPGLNHRAFFLRNPIKTLVRPGFHRQLAICNCLACGVAKFAGMVIFWVLMGLFLGNPC